MFFIGCQTKYELVSVTLIVIVAIIVSYLKAQIINQT